MRERGLEEGARERVDAGVHLAERALLLRGVLPLDDADEGAGRVAHDAPVAGGVRGLGRQERHGGAGRATSVDEARERRVREERYVAREDEDLVRAGGRGERHADRVSRSELRLLDDRRDARESREVLEHLLEPAPHDDDDRPGAERERGGEDSIEEGAARGLVEDLRRLGAHPDAAPGG